MLLSFTATPLYPRLCAHHFFKRCPFCLNGCVSAVQVALGSDYVAEVEKHSSQKDAAKGFGGKYGVQKDRVDKVRRQADSFTIGNNM